MCGDDVDMLHLQPAQDEPETSRTSKVPPIIDWNKGDWVSVRFKSWCLRSKNQFSGNTDQLNPKTINSVT